MKKLVILLAICAICTPVLCAETKDKEPVQNIENNQAYLVANLQKQPKKDNEQKIGNHFSFFVINIHINGKADDLPDSNGK